MPGFIRFVVVALLIFLIYSVVKRLLMPQSTKKPKSNSGIKIFKKGEIEKPKYNIDAETVDFEEIKEKDLEKK